MLQSRIIGHVTCFEIVSSKIIVETLEHQPPVAQGLGIKWLVGQIDIDDFKEELYGKTKTARTRQQTVNHQDAYVAGYRKGRDVDIYEGIENQKKEVLILKD